MGLSGCFVATLFVLPALLALFEPPATTAFRFTLDRLVRWGGVHRVVLGAAGAMVTLASVAVAGHGASLFRPDADLAVLHPRPNSALDAQLEIGRRFGLSAGTMLVDLRASDDRKLVALAYEVQRRLSSPRVKAAGVAAVYGLATWLADPDVAAARGFAVAG